MSRSRRRFFLLTLLTVAASASAASARPPYKKALADFVGPGLPAKLNDCTTCHLPDPPGKDPLDKSKPHNAFGARLKAVRKELEKAGKPFDITDRLAAVAWEDSDGDGVPNLVELVTGHAPGDKDDRPTDAEAVPGRKRAEALLRSLAGGYRWAPLEKVQRPPIPSVRNAAWVRNPVDTFVAAEHERLGLTPRPEASRAVLLRRVTLDLTGLPPTPEELHAFLDDTSPDAYEKVVDRLLASPRYGERWGRHWMDVWRYSDWAGWGNQVRDSQPHIWHWRDWIIESLNADKGYDRMVLEMLAADELCPEDASALRATGYLVRNYKLLSREKWMEDTVEHTAQGFLGLTMACARCHDHMFDPVSQREYYQLRAVFEPHQVRTDRLPGFPDRTKNGLPRVFDADLNVPTYLFVRGDDRNPDRSKAIPPGVPAALGGVFKVEPVTLPRTAFAPDRRPFVIAEETEASAAAVKAAAAERDRARREVLRLAAAVFQPDPFRDTVTLTAGNRGQEARELAELDAQLTEAKHALLLAQLRVEEMEDAGRRNTPDWTTAATEATRTARQANVLQARRNLAAARIAEKAAAPAAKPAATKAVTDAATALAKAEADLKQPDTTAFPRRNLPTYPPTSSGRRLALARWIADRDNPLTARVAVNHVWLRHFNQAIVPSVFDFGRNGRPPSHPALLDWLAADFMEHGWSQKHLHRLIVTSSTYRMASTPDEADSAKDPDNRYLWRMNSHRVEAEAVRDMVFYVAGRLDLTTGGPDLDHALGLTVPRRSLYFQHAAEKQMEFLKLFDAAAVSECYQRKESILPQQALALSNSEVTLRHARILARTLHPKAADDAAFTVAAFERVLSRPPTEAEKTACADFLKEQAARLPKGGAAAPDPDGKTPAAEPALRARENLVHVLMNHHDFVTVR